ncbi:sister chromatid cohesion C-terminus-domain-containing protein [Phaeosphaeria sp. MPI-PUGE-AT-0046c]|nr:sister chromatid cohesion C-terminus-domain-containing protein [Phaeosphaeria sp. MPI-PUGE-AT-0046c]
MSGPDMSNWHNANGVGLALRPPPTVDEAAMYSPFTSIMPFPSDIIPFPTAEPPTPPSTLTPDQQVAAQRAVGILNNEIEGQTTAQHLNDTLAQLKRLLDPKKLPQYNFKPMPQLETPPPESPTKDANGATPSHAPALSPFAALLLGRTDVSFTSMSLSALSAPTPTKPAHEAAQPGAHQLATPAKQQAPVVQAHPATQPRTATSNGASHAQNAHLPYPSSALSSVPSSTPPRPSPVLQVKPKPISGRREEYIQYDTVNPHSLSQGRPEEQGFSAAAASLKPQEREIADRKIQDFRFFINTLLEDKDELEDSSHFIAISTHDGDFTVLKPKTMDTLSDKMTSLANFGRFSALPAKVIMDTQSLLQPSIITATKNASLSPEAEAFEWSDSIEAARVALKASRMVLDSMIEGRDDHHLRREEIIDMVIDLIKFVKDACIVPVLQVRRSAEDMFNIALGLRKELQIILRLSGGVLSRFASLIGKYKLSERAVNSLEYLAQELVMEQNSESEKDSIFTIQKFELFRQRAVDVLAEIFAQHSEQQTSILNGILSNLEKLPDKKASARQFKSARGPAIMTISALFMRFVQVAATNKEAQSKINATHAIAASDDEESDREPGVASRKPRKRSKRPSQLADDLFKNAQRIAQVIATSLVDRASNVSKTGDKPFRNLLDLFVDDFCNVLGSSEWPAADMLLQQLTIRMEFILRDDVAAKQTVVDKDMALSALSRIGCGILDLKQRLNKMKREEFDVTQSDISSKLGQLIDEAMVDDIKERINDVDLLAFDGPHRIVVESLPDYLELQSSHDDPRLRSVSGCHITAWFAALNRAFPPHAEGADPYPLAVDDVRRHLEAIIMDPAWLSQKFQFPPVSAVQSQLAAGIVTLQNQLCRHMPYIVNKMLERVRDKSSSKLRARGMDGLRELVQKDPKVVTQGHIAKMLECFHDASPMVRESTLSLVQTCLEYQRSLLPHFFNHILRLAHDPSNGPKKKAIKLLKDIYNRSSSMEQKRLVIVNLLPASQDEEKTISDLARNVLEEMLLSSGKSSSRVDESQLKLDRAERSRLIIETIQEIFRMKSSMEALEKFFIHVLSQDAKADESHTNVCTDLVVDMIDEIISPRDTTAQALSQAHIMTALSMFAKVRPTLFTVGQMHDLKLYIKSITSVDDLPLLQPTVIVFRYVFPTLGTLQPAFAEEVRASLLKHVPKLATWAKAVDRSFDTLMDVAHCLWTVSPMTDQGVTKLCATITSIMCQLRPFKSCTQQEAAQEQGKIQTWLILLGVLGQVCNFDEYSQEFHGRLKLQVSNHVAKQPKSAPQFEIYSKVDMAPSLLLLETVRAFVAQSWDMSVRVQALRSVGGICQRSPHLFMRNEIETIYKLVFINSDNDQLRRVALSAFLEYFAFAERRSESGAEIAVGKGAATGNARLETSFVANENDSATLHIAQKFLQSFVDSALQRNDELAVSATRIIASVSRQGLVHPKECGAALVALGTSSDPVIQQTAITEHKRIHEKQESYLEKEYMQAVRLAFDYQSNVFSDTHGMRNGGQSAKLAGLFEALKSGKKATFKKFVTNICRTIDFNFAKLDTADDVPKPVLFARFCLENLALLDFSLLEEVALCLNALEAIVLKTTGPIVALTIESEMPKRATALLLEPNITGFHQPLEGTAGVETSVHPSQPALPNIDDARLRHITAACMILKMIWETRGFVRRCYGQHKVKGGIPLKEYPKPTTRNNLVSGKELWESLASVMGALDSRDSMLKACYDFADILDVDREAEVGEDGEADDLGAGYETPTEEDGTVQLPTSGRGRKRKTNVSMGGTPKRPRARLSGSKNKKRNSRTPDIDDDSD